MRMKMMFGCARPAAPLQSGNRKQARSSMLKPFGKGITSDKVPVAIWRVKLTDDLMQSEDLSKRRDLFPLTQTFHIICGAVTKPAIKLGGVFQLLAPHAGNDDIAAVDFREAGHIHPEFFKL